MTAAKLNISKQVVVTDFDNGEGILVDLNTKRYFQLNETAMIIWRGLEQGKSTSEIVADVRANYEVDADRASLSVERLLDTFQTYKLVSEQS